MKQGETECIKEFSIAPMLGVTDRHCRVLLRLLTRRAKLYTEMTVGDAIMHGDRARFLAFDAREHPLALQLGGAEPRVLATCAKWAERAGYDEINLNVGCPSSRVKSGQFGACLMAKPQLVADCVAAMRDAVELPITVKTRTGIDELDTYSHFAEFIARVAQGGCAHFIIHARKAWLRGLSPKQNRNVPPLQYDRVHQAKRDFPELRFTLNGGVQHLTAAREHLRAFDGVMMGRAAYHDPWQLRNADRMLFADDARAPLTPAELIRAYLPYMREQLAHGAPLHSMTRHLLGLFRGCANARSWRRQLAEQSRQPGAGVEVVLAALRLVEVHDDDTVESEVCEVPVETAMSQVDEVNKVTVPPTVSPMTTMSTESAMSQATEVNKVTKVTKPSAMPPTTTNRALRATRQ